MADVRSHLRCGIDSHHHSLFDMAARSHLWHHLRPDVLFSLSLLDSQQRPDSRHDQYSRIPIPRCFRVSGYHPLYLLDIPIFLHLLDGIMVSDHWRM